MDQKGSPIHTGRGILADCEPLLFFCYGESDVELMFLVEVYCMFHVFAGKQHLLSTEPV